MRRSIIFCRRSILQEPPLLLLLAWVILTTTRSTYYFDDCFGRAHRQVSASSGSSLVTTAAAAVEETKHNGGDDDDCCCCAPRRQDDDESEEEDVVDGDDAKTTTTGATDDNLLEEDEDEESKQLVCSAMNDVLPRYRQQQRHDASSSSRWNRIWNAIASFLPQPFCSSEAAAENNDQSASSKAEWAVAYTHHRRRRMARSVPCRPLDHCNTMLEVYHHPSTSTTSCSSSGSSSSSSAAAISYAYELLEPVELELGIAKSQHVVDYAYSPVVHAGSKEIIRPPIVPSDGDEDTRDQREGNNRIWMEETLRRHSRRGWWQWWIPWEMLPTGEEGDGDLRRKYKMDDEAFAGGSHGEVWRGRRKCVVNNDNNDEYNCTGAEPLIFKRLKVERGFRTLEAGLREVYFGNLLQASSEASSRLFTEYIEHFFGEEHGELWIVFKDAGPSLRSLLYTTTDADGYVIFQHSWLWTLIRMSLARKTTTTTERAAPAMVGALSDSRSSSVKGVSGDASSTGRQLLGTFLRQILQAASLLHENGIIHRDIKPSNIMCDTDINLEELKSFDIGSPHVECVLGDFSSAVNTFTNRNLYTRGPSRLEQTDEYAPPEAIFGDMYSDAATLLTPAFDSWSIGIVALELLLGSPNVFSVDQRTRMVLSHRMQKEGASKEEIERAMYLAALSQFCIYNPSDSKKPDWPLRQGDPLHRLAMTKQSCTLNDFRRALRARDPLGWGVDDDSLLHLIWQLLSWNPRERMTPAEALRHPYFGTLEITAYSGLFSDEQNALESQMLDPRMDFNLTDVIEEFTCPKCGRTFSDWRSCHSHVNSRRHGRFCTYDHSSLPTCINAHSMLPAHPYSGYCDIQGRRRTIEDFHAIHLLPSQQFYGIFDGHLGNLASKYAASFLYRELSVRLTDATSLVVDKSWKAKVEKQTREAFVAVHDNFLKAIELSSHGFMDQSGTTATTLLVTNGTFVISSLGDSRAVLASVDKENNLVPLQLTKDHVASDGDERRHVESRGGMILRHNGMDRVNGTLAITRSIGDASLSPFLSRQPHVVLMTRVEILEACGALASNERYPCFMILASDGLWDTVDNQEAVDLVAQVVSEAVGDASSWKENAGLQRAAEALTHEAYVRGSTDNIGVCIIAIE